MIEVICVKGHCLEDLYVKEVKEGEVYFTDDYYNPLSIGSIVFLYHENCGCKIPIGPSLKEYFITLAEYREQQMKSILDD